jgi:MATE family multidrug resistance protein
MPRTMIAAGVAALATGLLALLLVIGRGAVVSVFPATLEVHALALAMLPLWAPFILFDGVQIVFVYALRSLGDQVAAGVNSIIAFFLVTGGAGWWLIQHGAGLSGLVYASGAGMVAAAALHGGRLLLISRRFRQSSAQAGAN